MKISQAMDLVNDEYNQECLRAREDPTFGALMAEAMGNEYDEIDAELPGYVIDIASASGVPAGTVLPGYVYQMARMCFRLGMRVQRKLERPEEATSLFWRSDQEVV
jgi:hypothetical protein